MDRRKIKLKVEFYPHVRKIKVFSDKIIAPAKIEKIDELIIDYKASSSPLMMAFGFVSIIILISAVSFLGFLSFILIPLVAFLIFTIDNRRKSKEIIWLRNLLPEKDVVNYVKLSIKKCLEKDVEKTEIKDDTKDVELIVTCGYPTKCIEYDRKRVNVLGMVYLAVALSILTGYYVLQTIYFTVVLLVSSMVVILSTKYKVCSKYKIKKLFEN